MSEREKAVQINVTAPPNSGKTDLMKYLVGYYGERFGSDCVTYVKYPVYKPEEHGAIDYLMTGYRIDAYLRHGNYDNWDPRTAQSYFATNRFFFDIKIREWLDSKKVILSEDGKYTSVIWGGLTDQSLSRRELEQMNAGIIEPDIRFTLRGPRLEKGIEANHQFEQSGWWGDCEMMHMMLAEELGWGMVDYQKVEGEDCIREETTRVGNKIINQSEYLFTLREIQRRKIFD